MLARSKAGKHTPYHWLSRAVADSATLILDVGCGTGTMSGKLQRSDRVVFGLDSSKGDLEIASSRSTGPWVQGDPLNLPFADRSFDAITLSMGLGAIRRIDDLLKEVGRVLRPGGVVAGLLPTVMPAQPAQMLMAAQLSVRLRTAIRFPGQSWVGFAAACTAAGLTKVEDARQRYLYSVKSADDAHLLIAGLDLSGVSEPRVEEAVNFLVGRVKATGEVTIAVPLRRIIAIK